MSKNKEFTSEELIEIKKLFEAGELVGRIARQFKTNSKHITQTCIDLNFSTKNRRQTFLTQQEQDKIVELFNKGWGAHRISRELNTKKRVIRRYYKKLGLYRKSFTNSNKKKILTSQDLLKIQQLYTNGMAIKKIAKLFKTDHQRIKGICIDGGIQITKRKTSLSEKELDQIKKLFDAGLGIYKISKKLNITQHNVRKAYKILGFNATGRKSIGPRVETPAERECKICHKIKPISEFRSFVRQGRIIYTYICKEDYKKKQKEERETVEAKKRRQKWHKNRYDTDINYRLQTLISVVVRAGLKNSNSSKNGKKMSEYLDYTMEQLKNHIENTWHAPENLDKNGNVWMSWKNYGKEWHIDHIIPQACLLYTSVSEEIFKFCWSLSNLRAYSANQNIKDGSTRIRHKYFIWLLYCLMAQCYLVEKEMNLNIYAVG